MSVNTRPHRHPLEDAAQKFGSEAALARALGVSRGALNQWKNRGRHVPAEHAPEIERLTGVPCERLCPSIRWAVRGVLWSRQAAREADQSIAAYLAGLGVIPGY